MRKERPKIRVVMHAMVLDGELVSIDPASTDLPDRCKLAMAEMITGRKHEFVKPAANDS